MNIGLLSRFDVIPWRRIVCAGMLALLSVALVCLLSADAMKWGVRYLGYYFVFVIVAASGYYAFRAWRQSGVIVQFAKKDLICGGLSVLVGAWVIFVHATLDYKIAMDDYLLAATAKSLHETREVSMVTLGNYWGDAFVSEAVEVDKRPWFYPFVVSVLYDVFGYSERIPFLLNAFTGVAFLCLVYVFGHWMGGRSAGVLSVLLWASLPLLSQNATGAGMEMLNLFMLQLLCVVSVVYLRAPGAALEALVSLTAVLLVYTRYESGLFVFPAAIVILLGWWRSGRIYMSWGVVLSSVALIAVALQTRMYSLNDAAWELMDGAVEPFAWGHLIANIPHALNFFLSCDMSLANSPLLGLLAVPAVLAFVFLLGQSLRFIGVAIRLAW
ncbi:glycosyltransferase family 39 protein [Coraliomargarita algicola]|uniref:Glycosyltransferase family 39 protein n=1 Tax=Coraliomargarita algicola TaxID=3092156 RepID=A0ABZ0RFI7_9BACT|nr:glycosyltransferase family 39 protein [Coraliomargarita sp. J2-16]WPJ94171.1 glycosyltransferase family 39 protein [Coraliomargarita sp. J2-16]